MDNKSPENPKAVNKANTDAPTPTLSKADREILELRVDLEIEKAKASLTKDNEQKLERIVEEKYKPKIQFWQKNTALAFVVLLGTLVWEKFGLPEKIKGEANTVFETRFVEPQVSNTLNTALSAKAIPMINERIAPVQSNINNMARSISLQEANFSNSTIRLFQLDNEARLLHAQIDPLSNQLASLDGSIKVQQQTIDRSKASFDQQQEKLATRISGSELVLTNIEHDLVNYMATMHSAITNADELREEQRVTSLLNRISMYDASAYPELQKIAQGTNELSKLATLAIDVVKRHLMYDNSQGAKIVAISIEGTNKFHGPFSDDELAFYMEGATDSNIEGLVNLADGRPALVSKIVRVAQYNQNLLILNRTIAVLNKETGEIFDALDLKKLKDWWSTNKQNYYDIPVSNLEISNREFGQSDYIGTWTNLESIITNVPTADWSRAKGIVCQLKFGNFEKAVELNKGFSDANGRWKKISDCVITLDTNRFLGTSNLVVLSKEHPEFLSASVISPYVDSLSQIDRSLYNDLMSKTNSP